MRLTCARQGSKLTRYWISAHLGPRSHLILAHPETGEIFASWASGLDSAVVRGVWLSSIPGLIGLVDGVDHGFGDDGRVPDRELERVGVTSSTLRQRPEDPLHS